MKWIFLLVWLMVTPALAAFLRGQPRFILHACFAIGAMFYFLDPLLYVAPVSWPTWPGSVKGVEISLIDSVAIAIIYATRGGVRTPLGITIGFSLYAAAIVISTLANMDATTWPSIFYATQVLRAVIVFIAFKRAAAMYPSAPVALLGGLSIGIFYNCFVAAQQFLGGATQAGGAMGHQNLLGMTTHFATMAAFALLLAGRRTRLAVGIVLAGAIIALVGGSRATIGLFAIGLGITTVLSMRSRMTGRKGAFAAVAAIAVALSLPAMMWAVDRRPESARESSNDERRSFIEAAQMIIADHPLGVGGNRYVTVANVGGYSARAGVAWNWQNRSAPVHNAYYLVAAELGYLGLLGMLIVLGSVIYEGVRSLRRLTGEQADLALGFTAATIVVAAHHYFEWVYMTYNIHYLTAMSMGALVGLTRAPRPVARTTAAGVAGGATTGNRIPPNARPASTHSPVY